MAEIELKKRAVYAGDVHIALLKAGWSIREACDFVNGLPKADVAPVRPGQWRRTGRIFDGFIEIQCSECEETHLFDAIRLETAARHCPYCGAKWERGADNGERKSGTQPQREDT